MREIIERYIKEEMGDRDAVTMRDFYQIYRGIEIWNDRTPLMPYVYKGAFYLFFDYLSKIIIRTGYVYTMGYDLGCIFLLCTNKVRNFFRLSWRKEWKRFKNYDVYIFESRQGSVRYGTVGVRAWIKEIRQNNDMPWMESLEEEDEF